MALVLKDRVKETSTTTGTGTFTLAGAATGFQSFSVIGNSNTVYYAIVLNGANEWEIGVGTYTSSGTTLSRDTVLESSNSGSKVSFSAGAKEVFCTYPAEKAVTIDDVQTLSNKTLASPSVTGSITFNDASTQNTAATGFGFKNRIINGAMVVNQRGGTVSSDPGGPYGIDRFRGFGAGGGVFTMVQSSTVPTGQGFVNSCLLTVTTADSSIASGDYYAFNQDIEGFNIADLGWGTASAITITVSFWINTSVAGLYALGICNFNGTRCYPATFTVAASTWTYVTLTIPGCTDGTWSTTNTSGIVFRLDLGSGSNNNGTANTWNTAGSYAGCRTSSTVNWIATSGATFYITGVQLEKGSTATSFDVRPYTTELALCQRYAFKRLADGSVNNYAPLGMGRYYGTNAAQLYVPFPVTMRTSPSSITVSGTILVNDLGFGGADLTSPVLNESSCDGATITGSTSTGTTAGYATTFYASNTSVASILFSAEL